MVRAATLLSFLLAACRFDASGLAPTEDARPRPVVDRGAGGSGDGAHDRAQAGELAGPVADARPPDTIPACPAGASWTSSAVAVGLGSNGGDTYDPALALDSKGDPHIVYYNYNQGKVLYASWSGASWSSVEIAPSGGANWHWWSALVIDAKGVPYAAYHKTGCNVMVASRPVGSTAWSLVTLEGSAATMSLGLDTSGKAHLAYTVTSSDASSPGTIKVTSNLAGAWTNPGAKVGDGHYTSLALDDQGHRHLAWYETPQKKLRYATDATGSWVLESPDSAASAGEFPSLVRRPDGTIVIAYYDRANGDLKLAVKSGSGWTREVVDAKDDVGRYPSLAVSPDGTLNISYYDATQKDLRHARGAPKSWSLQTVDAQGEVGRFPSLAIGPDRRAHLAYFDDTGKSVKYATNPCR